MGIERAKALETFQGFAYIVNAALGGKQPKPLQNEAQAKAAFAGIFGKNSVADTGAVDPFTGLEETFTKLDKVDGN